MLGYSHNAEYNAGIIRWTLALCTWETEMENTNFVSTGLSGRHKREKSEEKIDCHHQDSN